MPKHEPRKDQQQAVSQDRTGAPFLRSGRPDASRVKAAQLSDERLARFDFDDEDPERWDGMC